MTDEQFDKLMGKLDELIGCLNRQPSSNAPKANRITPKGDLETIVGVVAYPEWKAGKKRDFLVFKLQGTERTDVDCKCFNSSVASLISEGATIACIGHFDEWNGYTSFIVEEVEVRSERTVDVGLEKDRQARQNKKKEEPEEFEDDVPF